MEDRVFCGNTGYQGICVIDDVGSFKYCTAAWGYPTDGDCIPGNGSELTSCPGLHPTTTTSSARETITG